MNTFYKVFLILFIVFIGINLYAIDWQSGFMSPDNYKFLFSIATGIIGILLTLALNIWRKLANKEK